MLAAAAAVTRVGRAPLAASNVADPAARLERLDRLDGSGGVARISAGLLVSVGEPRAGRTTRVSG